MIHPRLATVADVNSISNLVNQAYGHYIERLGRKPIPMTTNYLVAIQKHQMWVLETTNGLKAVLELISFNTYLLIENIAVAAAYQQQGIGRELMSFAELQALAQGFSETRLYTNALFVENLAFYKMLGYQETHREPYKGSSVVHMYKLLTESKG